MSITTPLVHQPQKREVYTFIQDRTNLQALNRYSYVENNPLSYTDPTGYFLEKKLKNFFRTFDPVHYIDFTIGKKLLQKVSRVKGLSTVISVALNFIPGCQGWCSMAFNAALTATNGGTIDQVLTGAAVGIITSGIPGTGQVGGVAGFANAVVENQAVAAMLSSGIMAKAQGGKFIDGVKGAAVGGAISGAIGWVIDNWSTDSLDWIPYPDQEALACADPVGTCGVVNSAQKATVKFNYKTGGLEKFQKAVEKYGVTALFEDVLPAGEHVIDVSIDKTIDAGMENPNAQTIKVNPDFLKEKPVNFIASAIGHELIHVDDHLRGNMSVYDSASVRTSERRAYMWQNRNSRHFNLGIEYKAWFVKQISKYR